LKSLLTFHCYSRDAASALETIIHRTGGNKFFASWTIDDVEQVHTAADDAFAGKRFEDYVNGFERGLQFGDAIGPLSDCDRKQLIRDVLEAMRAIGSNR